MCNDSHFKDVTQHIAEFTKLTEHEGVTSVNSTNFIGGIYFPPLKF